jgi:hypothetical protein
MRKKNPSLGSFYFILNSSRDNIILRVDNL